MENSAWMPVDLGFTINKDGIVRGPQGNIIKPYNSHGYSIVSVRVKVHRAVLMAFIGPPPPGKNQGRHLDGNRNNNNLSNLSWGSSKENVADSIKHGTHITITMKRKRGVNNAQSKLTNDQVVEIKKRAATGRELNKEIARDYPVSYGTINKIIRGEDWAHVII